MVRAGYVSILANLLTWAINTLYFPSHEDVAGVRRRPTVQAKGIWSRWCVGASTSAPVSLLPSGFVQLCRNHLSLHSQPSGSCDAFSVSGVLREQDGDELDGQWRDSSGGCIRWQKLFSRERALREFWERHPNARLWGMKQGTRPDKLADQLMRVR
ncbi:hypothetical protein C8Q76DRAFT_76472 [Earliella scabrosa]|nr:hypothetical protein C8Q76DRAFT_76472 [Earliella scabrosa]